VIRSRIIVFMNKRKPVRLVLTELARRHEYKDSLLNKNGEPNGSAIGRALKVSQATISRALGNPNYEPSHLLVDAMCSYFGITTTQARGEESLSPPPPDDGRLSARAKNLAKRYEKLRPAQKKIIDEMVGQLEPVVHTQQQTG
jgi:hypothetical protein